jgi:NitT/TauT family transport system ATP-binding protein
MDQGESVTHPSGCAVRVDRVIKTFDNGVTAVNGVSLDVPAGQFLALLGPSGCGKSTLLRIIAGLETPTNGAVHLGTNETDRGESLTRSDVAFVFQDAHLLPWRTVHDNVELPLELRGVPKLQRSAAVLRELELVGLADAVDRHPSQLSGGMRMRVSLARAMVTRPRLLLLDEPFAALDEITRQHLDAQLLDIWARTRMTVLFVTHSTVEATYLAQRAIVFSHRPARIVLDHAIELPSHRPGAIRGEPEFARQTRVLYDALEGGTKR